MSHPLEQRLGWPHVWDIGTGECVGLTEEQACVLQAAGVIHYSGIYRVFRLNPDVELDVVKEALG